MLACDAITPRRRVRAPQQKTLPPIHPNVGVEVAYQKRLDALITEMHRSLLWYIRAEYRANPPIMATDEPSIVGRLRRMMQKLGQRWLDRFAEAAPKLARYFATASKDRVDGALAASLREAGFSVKFQMTAAAKEAFEATVAENVSLIKSIASEHLTQVQGAVMRSVTAGRDVGGLAKELEERFGVTKRRAALIARSQNNIATATITKVRQLELGITKAIWRHSSAGRHPRPEHVAANGKEYDVAQGMFLEGEYTWPGRAINCRCVSRSIIPALQK